MIYIWREACAFTRTAALDAEEMIVYYHKNHVGIFVGCSDGFDDDSDDEEEEGESDADIDKDEDEGGAIVGADGVAAGAAGAAVVD